MKIKKVSRADVTGLLWKIRANPDLWDRNTARTAPETSPHHGLSDIWARYAPLGVDGSKPHRSIWYDTPLTEELQGLASQLVSLVDGEELGGVLITRIPPGGLCKPHTDPGWHARYYEKLAVQVESAPGQAFCFEGESLVTQPGDVFWFDNAHTHWVPNESSHERITAIFCIKTRAFEALKDETCPGE